MYLCFVLFFFVFPLLLFIFVMLLLGQSRRAMAVAVRSNNLHIGSAINGDGAGGLGEAGPRIAACRVVVGESCGRHLGRYHTYTYWRLSTSRFEKNGLLGGLSTNDVQKRWRRAEKEQRHSP